jgi:uncharacterized metal-binding protein YceD (DUF177 family)
VKINLSDIPEEGLTCTEPFDPQKLNLQTPELKFLQKCQVTATFHLIRDTVTAQVKAAGELELVCGRCLELYHRPYDGHFNLCYDVKGKVALEVTDDIRQEILLSYPVIFLCKEGCLGLCPRCGENRNLGNCGCEGVR